VLVLGDSFMRALSPYLNQSFGTVVYAPRDNAKTLKRLNQYLRRYEPELVLVEMVDRSLKPENPPDRERGRGRGGGRRDARQ
jgi:hypothetical protein